MRRCVKSSTDSLWKLTAKTWPDMVKQLADKGYQVDSAYKCVPEKYILAYKDNSCYRIEVTQYFRSNYEVQSCNIHLDNYNE